MSIDFDNWMRRDGNPRHKRFSDKHGNQKRGYDAKYTCCICKEVFLLRTKLLEHKRDMHSY